ncbi:MAG TPA: ATP synthase F1 subunit epsilon [Thermoanaerobaculia bacterium]
MARGLFHLSIITPERAVLETDASFVAFPAWDGEVGILHGRAPLLFKLGVGRLRAETPEGEQVFYVDGGFAQMVEERLTILTQQAKRPQEIDRAAAERALAQARETPAPTADAVAARQRAVERARAQLRLVS